MLSQFIAIINPDGYINFNQNIKFDKPKKALIIFNDDLDDINYIENNSSYLLSEKSLSEFWNRIEEDEAWDYLQQEI